MAALTADATRLTRNTDGSKIESTAVGTGATVYTGGLIAINTSTGRAVAATDAASRAFGGLALETKTGDTAGTVYVTYAYDLEALIANQTAMVHGTAAYVSTDNDVTTAAVASNDYAVGRVTGSQSSKVWVWLGVTS